ncbi:uncharacterized protein Dana_GF22550 [Drosophila ananassae]|uniref:Chromo domain-containing protein n=1 Tax=Drosophila ananassae TaxID=7217 RepID=B3MVR8_DROAN|nr:M-phase phosphoprotein 8 [Drosophila ananassae]EDV35063.1 uncharacterized protein Dana_GF22550 [Drosophila ananassae]
MAKLGKKKVVEEQSRKKIKNGADSVEETKKHTEKNAPVERATRRSSNADTGSSSSISTAPSSARKKQAQKRKAKSSDRSSSEDSDDLPLNGRQSAAAKESKEDDSRSATPAKKRKQAKTKPQEKPTRTSPNKNGKKSSKPSDDVEEDDSAVDDSDAESGGEEYEVEAIIGHKTVRGVSHFLVRWKGYDESEDTWEPEADLNCNNLITQFRAKETKQENTKVKVTKGSKATPKKAATGGRASTGNTGGGGKKSATSDDPNEKEWVVERIIDYVEDEEDGGLYRIRWKGFGAKDDTWEPESNLSCQGLIEKFKRQMDTDPNVDPMELRESPKKTKRLVNECYPRTSMHNRIERSSKRAVAKNRVFYGEE